MKPTVDCRIFRDRMTHFLAEEVPAAERAALQDHLDGCEACSAHLGVEDAFGRALARRLAPVPAPPGLETRIRARLAEATPAGSAGWLRSPWFAGAAASLLLAALILVGQGDPRAVPRATGAVEVVRQHVTVVDRDCERAGASYAQQRRCRHPKHLNLLKVSDGNYWFVSLDHEAARRILLEPEMRGRHLLVDGDLYPEIRTLRLTDFRPLDDPRAGALPASF